MTTDREATIRQMAEQCTARLLVLVGQAVEIIEQFAQAVAAQAEWETREQCAQIAQRIIDSERAWSSIPEAIRTSAGQEDVR